MPDLTSVGTTAALLALAVWVGGIALTMLLAFVVIRAAVRAALADHYLRVQHYQASGIWDGRRVPRRMPVRRHAAPISPEPISSEPITPEPISPELRH